MRCNSCQNEFEGNVAFCPHCGAPVAESTPDSGVSQPLPVTGEPTPVFETGAPLMINPLLAKTDALVKDKLFLAACILQTAANALPLFNRFSGFNVLGILVTVFLWIIYAESKKGLPNPQRIRVLSGVVFAYYVILYVCAGLLALMGILCFFSFTKWVNLFTDAFSGNAQIDTPLDSLVSMGGWFVGLVLIISAAIMAVLNFFAYGKIHKFVKSCYENILNNVNNLENRNITFVWMIVLAVFQGIGALGNIVTHPISTVVAGCGCAFTIIIALLIKKYYSEYN